MMELDMGSRGKQKKGGGMQDSGRELGGWSDNTSPFFFSE